MKSVTSHTVLLDRKDTSLSLKGLRTPSIPEPAVPITVNGIDQGRFQGLEVFEHVPHIGSFPQTIADLVANCYFRLTYQNHDGSSATFGTSVIGAPSFRTKSNDLILIPTVQLAEVSVCPPHRLRINISAEYKGQALISIVRTYAKDAVELKTEMHTSWKFTALSDIAVTDTLRGVDAFRLLSLSSMFSDESRYDADLICCSKQTGDVSELRLNNSTARNAYLLPRTNGINEIGLIKTAGSKGARGTPGSIDSPSITARLVESSIPHDEIGFQSYLTDSKNINDDSLSAWFEWSAAPAVIKKGCEITASFEVRANHPRKFL